MSATQRNLSHDPQTAAMQRKVRRNREQAKQQAEAKRARERARDERRTHGRILDQIETCYRQWTPIQVKNQGEMVSIPVRTSDEDILNRPNCNFFFQKTDESIMGADLL